MGPHDVAVELVLGSDVSCMVVCQLIAHVVLHILCCHYVGPVPMIGLYLLHKELAWSM